MSLLAVRSAPFLLSDFCSSIRSASVSSSLSDMAASSLDFSSSDTLNLEDIKIQLSQCCLTCGVCWKDEHFSFDCSECGGYSMNRPCMNCGGNCGALWTRDFAMVSWNLEVNALVDSLINTILIDDLFRATLATQLSGRAPASTFSINSRNLRLTTTSTSLIPTLVRPQYVAWVSFLELSFAIG